MSHEYDDYVSSHEKPVKAINWNSVPDDKDLEVWNRLTVNTVLSTVGELSVETQASTDLNGVQWAYLPANP